MRAGGLLASAGLAVSLTSLHPFAALLGFACVGAGIANTVPALFRAAGAVPGVPPAHALAAVTTVGYLGFLAGPAVIGGVAEIAGVRVALGLVVMATLVIALGASAARVRAASSTVGCNHPPAWASNSPQSAR